MAKTQNKRKFLGSHPTKPKVSAVRPDNGTSAFASNILKSIGKSANASKDLPNRTLQGLGISGKLPKPASKNLKLYIEGRRNKLTAALIKQEEFSENSQILTEVTVIGKYLKDGINDDFSTNEKKIIKKFQRLPEDEKMKEFERLKQAYFNL